MPPSCIAARRRLHRFEGVRIGNAGVAGEQELHRHRLRELGRPAKTPVLRVMQCNDPCARLGEQRVAHVLVRHRDADAFRNAFVSTCAFCSTASRLVR